jgi:cell division protein FtsB
MDDQFYRKARPKYRGWLTKFAKNKTVLVTAMVVVPIIGFVTFSNKGVLKRLSLEAEKRTMEERVSHAQAEQVRLQELSRSLETDPKAIEKVAREKYGMIREGETVYKVKRAK